MAAAKRRPQDAAPFVAQALAGLAGRALQHEDTPEKIAARAVALGVATAEALSVFIDKIDER